MGEEREGARRANAATGFTRGWETMANAWAMFLASVRRHLLGSLVLAAGVAGVWSAVELGSLAHDVPAYVVATLRGRSAEMAAFMEAFNGRSAGFLFRFWLGRTFWAFVILATVFAWLMIAHGQRIMSGRRRRGVRITTHAGEVKRQQMVEMSTLVLGAVGLWLFPRVLALRTEDAALMDWMRVLLARASSLVAWSVSADGEGAFVWIDRSLSPGFYAIAEADAYFHKRLASASNLTRLVAEAVVLAAIAWAIRLSLVRRRRRALALDPPYDMAGVPVSGASLTKHVLVAGSPGSGKSVAIFELLDQVRARALPAVVYDTGEFIERFMRPHDVLWNPADARCVPWTPFAEIETPQDAQAIATGLCPVSGANPFWDQAAATVLACTMLRLMEEGITTNRGMMEFFTKSDTTTLHAFLKGTEGASYVDPAAGPMSAGVRSTLMNRLQAFAWIPDPAPGEEAFSIRKFIRERADDAWFFFGTTEIHAATLRPVVSLLADLAARSFLDLPVSQEPTWWLFLDEVAALHRVSGLEEVLPRGRKRGVVVVLGLQSVSQLRQHYGRDGADALLEQPQTWLLLRTAGFGAEDLAKILGQNEVDLPQESLSIGANSMRDGVNLSERSEHRPVVLPIEVRNFESCTGVLRLPDRPAIYRVRYAPKDRPLIAAQFVPRS